MPHTHTHTMHIFMYYNIYISYMVRTIFYINNIYNDVRNYYYYLNNNTNNN